MRGKYDVRRRGNEEWGVIKDNIATHCYTPHIAITLLWLKEAENTVVIVIQEQLGLNFPF